MQAEVLGILGLELMLGAVQGVYLQSFSFCLLSIAVVGLIVYFHEVQLRIE